MKIQLPDKVKQIIDTLQSDGYEAYAVGGCVRDSILGRTPEDWDITTSAMPEETKKLFSHTFDTGIEHGTITVLLDHEGFEVTTYRVDGRYEDSRHPTEVTFVRNLKEDLLRRDFTINAMAYNDRDGLVDIFGGMEDLQKGIIRCVGNARARFSEDALRILRGVRFAAQLGFEIEDETREGMRLLAPTLQKISAERIQTELVKMLVSPRPDMLREAWKLGITKEFLPEFDAAMETDQETPHHMYTVGEHILHTLRNIRSDRVLRLTMLFHDMGKPVMKTVDDDGTAHFKGHAEKSREIARTVLRRLKFDNETLHKVEKLVYYHDYRMPVTAKCVRRAMNRIGEELFPLYLEVRRADVLAQSTYQREEKLADIDGVEKLYMEIRAKEQCVSLKELAVTGKDLIDAGMKPGKEIGRTLDRLLELVIEEPELNTKEKLLMRL
ncbi:MAG: CCA tRNA nucleotidyltransferase [Eubacteriales bacterium]|nr:CCA tRNA nucleotidyltransferase [Eubacteriales bacterium]